METQRAQTPDPLLDGADLPLAGVEVTHVRGVIQIFVARILKEDLGPREWETYLRGLSPGTQSLLRRKAAESEWVPMQALVEAVGKHPSSAGGAATALRGNLYADLMMTEKHRWMLKVMTPKLMVSQAPRIFAFYHHGGEMLVERLEAGRATVALRASGPSPPWFGVLIPTWFKRALELSGGSAVTVAHEPPTAVGERHLHRYWLSWA